MVETQEKYLSLLRTIHQYNTSNNSTSGGATSAQWRTNIPIENDIVFSFYLNGNAPHFMQYAKNVSLYSESIHFIQYSIVGISIIQKHMLNATIAKSLDTKLQNTSPQSL